MASRKKATPVNGAEFEMPDMGDVPRETVPVIEQWPIGELKAYSRNSRTHSPDQVLALARSIEQFGFTMPVLISEDGTIIAGHGRKMAAERLGLAHVPVIIAQG